MANQMTILDPITARDFSRGRITKATVSPGLSPLNSVANSINVDFSEVIGAAVVRKGTSTLSTIEYPYTTGQSFTNTVNGDEQSFDGANWEAQTFTPTTNQNSTLAISVKLYRVGTSTGNVTFSLCTTSGNDPTATVVNGNTFTLDASTITTSTNGAVYTFYLNPGTFLSTSTKYAIVLSYASGDVTHYIQWMRNQAGSVTGGGIRTSSDSGGTWGASSGALYFVVYVRDLNSTYSRAPMGNYSWISGGVARNVVAFRDDLATSVFIYYYNASSGTWRISNLQNLTYLKRCRFAALNGYVFVVNGSQAMKSSADFGATWGTTDCITVVVPSLITVSKNRLLVSGDATYPSRIWFSSVVDPAASPFITWNNNASTGDWIDINPDDGGKVTAFSLTSNQTLVFKDNAMYRLNTITKTVDSENIFNVGAVSQEAVTQCLGLTYFYSGNGIYQTDGTFPQQISRLGVQDFVDAITSSFGTLPTEVYAWSDGFNVYFSIGTVRVTFGPEDRRTYSNVVLKFSPRDQNWQVFTYPVQFGQTSVWGLPNSITVLAQGYDGTLMNTQYTDGNSDSGSAIPYSLETQELEFGNRAHTKVISDRMVVYTQAGGNGSWQIKENDGNFKSAIMPLSSRVNVGANVNFSANFFTFRWQGEAKGSRPMLQGYHLPRIQDLGIIN